MVENGCLQSERLLAVRRKQLYREWDALALEDLELALLGQTLQWLLNDPHFFLDLALVRVKIVAVVAANSGP